MVLVCLLLVGCSPLDAASAEAIATNFVNNNVGFFHTQDDSAVDVAQYDISPPTTYEEDGYWVVVYHVTSTIEDQEKDTDLVVKINSRGEVVEFNGQEVPR